MGLFSNFFKKKSAPPKKVEKNPPKQVEKPKAKKIALQYLPDDIIMEDYELSGAFRIDIIMVLAKATGDNSAYKDQKLLYQVIVEDGVIVIPLVLFKGGNKYGFFVFYTENEAANYLKYRKLLTEEADFEEVYYLSNFDPMKYEVTDGKLEVGTSFHALFRTGDDATEETYEGEYAMWWSSDDDPHLGSSPTKDHYRTIYDNLFGYESFFVGMLVHSLKNNEEISRISLPEETKTLSVIGPEDKKMLIELSAEKGIQFLFPTQNTSTKYRHNVLKLIAKSIKFLNAGMQERNVPQERYETHPKAYFDEIIANLESGRGVYTSLNSVTIGNPLEKIDPFSDDTIDLEKVVIRMKVMYENNEGPKSNSVPNIPEEMQPVMMEYHEDLMIGLAMDMGHSYTFINNKMLHGSSVSKEELANRGIQNIIAEVGEQIKVNGDPTQSHIMITCGGNHEMALLALDSFWDSIGEFIKSDFCVCFPVRDILMASNFYFEAGMDGLRDTKRKFYYDPNQPHLMSNGLYLRKDGKWKLIERVDPLSS